MLFNSKFFWTFALLSVILVDAQSSGDQSVFSTKIFSQNETQRYNLQSFYKGHNLSFAINDELTNNVSLSQKVSLNSTSPFNHSIDIQASITVEKEVDSFLAILDYNRTVFIYFIQTKKVDEWQITPNEKISCFNLIFSPEREKLIFDCLQEEDAIKSNVFFISDVEGKSISLQKNTLQSSETINTGNRSLICFSSEKSSAYLIRFQVGDVLSEISPFIDIFMVDELFQINLSNQINVSNISTGFALQDIQIGDKILYIIGKKEDIFYLNISSLSSPPLRLLTFQSLSIKSANFNYRTQNLILLAFFDDKFPSIMVVHEDRLIHVFNVESQGIQAPCQLAQSEKFLALACATTSISPNFIVFDRNRTYPDQIFYISNLPDTKLSNINFGSNGDNLAVTTRSSNLEVAYTVYNFTSPILTFSRLQNSGSFMLTIKSLAAPDIVQSISYVVMGNSISEIYARKSSITPRIHSNFDWVNINRLFYGAGIRYESNNMSYAIISSSLVESNVTFPEGSYIGGILINYNTSSLAYRILTSSSQDNNWTINECEADFPMSDISNSSIECKSSHNVSFASKVISFISTNRLYDVVVMKQGNTQTIGFYKDDKFILIFDNSGKENEGCTSILSQDAEMYPHPKFFCLKANSTNSKISMISAEDIIQKTRSFHDINTTSLGFEPQSCNINGMSSNWANPDILFIKCSYQVLLVDISDLSLKNNRVISYIEIDSNVAKDFSIFATSMHLIVVSASQNIIQEWNIEDLYNPYLRRNYPVFDYVLTSEFRYSELTEIIYFVATQGDKRFLLAFRPGNIGNGVLQNVFSMENLQGYNIFDISKIITDVGYPSDLLLLVKDNVLRYFIMHKRSYISYSGLYNSKSGSGFFNSLYDDIWTNITARLVDNSTKITPDCFKVTVVKNIQICQSNNKGKDSFIPASGSSFTNPPRFFFTGTIFDVDLHLDVAKGSIPPLNLTKPITSTQIIAFNDLGPSKSSKPVDIVVSASNSILLFDSNTLVVYNSTNFTNVQANHTILANSKCKNFVIDSNNILAALNCIQSKQRSSLIIYNLQKREIVFVKNYTNIRKLAMDLEGKHLAVLIDPKSKGTIVEIFELENLRSNCDNSTLPKLKIPFYTEDENLKVLNFNFTDLVFDFGMPNKDTINMFLVDSNIGVVICQIKTVPYSYSYLSTKPLAALLSSDHYHAFNPTFTWVHYVNVSQTSGSSADYTIILVAENFHSYMIKYSIEEGKVKDAKISLCFLYLSYHRAVKTLYSKGYFLSFGLSVNGNVVLFGYTTLQDDSDIVNKAEGYNYKTTIHSYEIVQNSSLTYLRKDEGDHLVPEISLPSQMITLSEKAVVLIVNPYIEQIQMFNYVDQIQVSWSEDIYGYDSFLLYAHNDVYSAEFTLKASQDFFKTHLALVWTIGVTVFLFIAIIIFIIKCLKADSPDKLLLKNEIKQPFVDEVFL